ncbi:MAG TPA: TonB-dependent receptor plug domain-containing protein, partial [Sphingobacteriaceae bacterium]
MKKIVYLLFLSIPVLSAAQTRTGKIFGQVLTAQGPAEFANVRLLVAKDSSFVTGITSGLDGRFELQVEADGEYLLSVASVGYKTLHSGMLKAGPRFPAVQATGLDLIADNRMLKEVAVVAAVPFVETSADKTVLNVENSVVSAGASALEILQKAPGVSIDKDDRVSLKGRSGVVVMINGKPTALSAGDLGAMLRAMNASTISKVEIITNPSAKYDAAGNSGIINIRTRKTANAGFDGSINAGAGYAKHTLYNGGINLNYQKGRMNIYGNYNHGRSDQFLGIDVNRSVVSGGQTTLF